jgi:hypothetical protein
MPGLYCFISFIADTLDPTTERLARRLVPVDIVIVVDVVVLMVFGLGLIVVDDLI